MAQPYSTIVIDAGDVVYDIAQSETSIQSLINLLQQAKDEGATTVVFLSGNYRGAKYVTFPGYYRWSSDED